MSLVLVSISIQLFVVLSNNRERVREKGDARQVGVCCIPLLGFFLPTPPEILAARVLCSVQGKLIQKSFRFYLHMDINR
jgi:hypothetical protein